MKTSKRSKHAKPISYKPAQVARRRTDTIAGAVPESPTPRKAARAAGAIDCPPPTKSGLDRIHITLPPGTELRVDFGLTIGCIVMSYPLGNDPFAVVVAEDGKPVRFEFKRVKAALALMGEGTEEGQG